MRIIELSTNLYLSKMWLMYYVFCFLVTLQFIYTLKDGDDCVNVDTTKGVCMIVKNCKSALRSIQSIGHHQYVRCGFNGSDELVCCPTSGIDKPSNTAKRPTNNRRGQRVADMECQKIVETSLPPLFLYSIIEGETASPGEFPFMVGLGYDHSNGYEFTCEGSLISSDYVLTAAHCIDTLDRITPSIVRLGVVEIGNGEFNKDTDIRIAKTILHPSYLRRTKYHDLALLRLEKQVPSSMYANPICLYTKDDDPSSPLTIIGWGKTSNAKDVKSLLLLKAKVTAVERSKCDESYTNMRNLPEGISEGQICAGDPLGLRDICLGVSGGPLHELNEHDGQYRLVGVTSLGRGCGSVIPGVYTRVSHYLDWIESIVWPNSS